MHRAGPAERRTATELRSGQPDLVADHPEQWRVSLGLRVDGLAVHVELDSHGFPFACCLGRAAAAHLHGRAPARLNGMTATGRSARRNPYVARRAQRAGPGRAYSFISFGNIRLIDGKATS